MNQILLINESSFSLIDYEENKSRVNEYYVIAIKEGSYYKFYNEVQLRIAKSTSSADAFSKKYNSLLTKQIKLYNLNNEYRIKFYNTDFSLGYEKSSTSSNDYVIKKELNNTSYIWNF